MSKSQIELYGKYALIGAAVLFGVDVMRGNSNFAQYAKLLAVAGVGMFGLSMVM